MRVLVVDDDAIQLEVVRAWLESAGHVVFTLNGPLGTSRLIRRERPDIVILDMMMPGLTGDRLGELISRDPGTKRVGLVFYSAEDPEVVEAKASGFKVLGAIRKTGNGERFLSLFHRLAVRHIDSTMPPPPSA